MPRTINLFIGGVSTSTPTPPPAGARFAGDPGAGNFYMGMTSSPITPIATQETEMNAPIAVLRTFSTSGGPNYSSIDSIISGGRIPWTSWKTPTRAGKTPAQVVADIATGAEDAWIDAIGAAFAARAPWPIVWTFWHEPENDADVSGANAPNYRAAQRRMATRIKALCSNSTFAAALFMCPFSFNKAASGRDWRIWYPDWKNVTGAGSSTSPDPNDFYLNGDPNSVVDLFGVDFYHGFNIQEPPIDSMSSWNTVLGSNVWTARLQPQTEFLGKPYAIGEWSTAAAQSGGIYDPDGDGSYTLTEYNNQVSNGTITFFPDQTNAWIDDYFGYLRQKNFVIYCYWDSTINKSATEVANNPLGRCDPDNVRWQRLGVWGRSQYAKVWTG